MSSGNPSSKRRYAQWLLGIWSLLLIVTAIAPLFPVNWWWVRIGDYPRLQLLIAYLATIAVLLFVWRLAWAKVCVAALAVCCGIQLFWILPYLPTSPESVQAAELDDPDRRIRILAANVLQSNRDAQPLLDLVQREKPDLLVLCEVNDRWMNDLGSLDERFAFAKKRPLENKYGMALYTNLEVVSAEVRYMLRPKVPSIDAVLRLPNGRPVRVFAVHPNPPRPGQGTKMRDAELVLVGREVANSESAIVLGDMNDVGWSRTTDLFQEISDLLDPRHGRGMYATFDAHSWILRYPLDYVFHTDDFRVAEIQVLEYIGSDHFPLLIELSYEPDAEDEQAAPALDPDDREDAQETVEQAK